MSQQDSEIEEAEGFHTIDSEEAERLRKGLPLEDLETLVEQLSLLGERSRLKILLFLSRQELCVHDLTAMLDMSQSAVSHQLAELREHGLVSKRKEGRVVYYSLSDERDLHGVREILDQLQ